MKHERSEMEETMRNDQPSEVGGVLRKTMGPIDAAERIKRMKLRKESRRIGKEQECLSFEEVIFFLFYLNYMIILTSCLSTIYIWSMNMAVDAS